VTKLGDWLPELFGASSDALQILDHIHKSLGETVTLSMPNGIHMQLITVITGTFPISLSFQQGAKLPLFTTGIGIAQLATRNDEEIAKAVKRANRRATSAQHRVNLDELMIDVEATRTKGYFEAYNRVVPDTGAIAMALPGVSSESALVVAVGGLSDRIKKNEAKIIKEMRQAIRHYKSD
jgi:DNA-binding IclR family transcriptional regulator